MKKTKRDELNEIVQALNCKAFEQAAQPQAEAEPEAEAKWRWRMLLMLDFERVDDNK